MNIVNKFFRSVVNGLKDNRAKSAQKTMLEELFNDYYIRRKDVYKMNFFRGIFFGLGSALGGTIVVALIIWVLSFFVNLPLISEVLRQADNSFNNQ